MTWRHDLLRLHGMLIRARKQQGLRQSELAALLDCSEKHIGRCERGEQDVSAIFLFRWCAALGIRLIAETDPEPGMTQK